MLLRGAARDDAEAERARFEFALPDRRVDDERARDDDFRVVDRDLPVDTALDVAPLREERV